MPSSQASSLNAQKSRDTASSLFPLETWRELEARIFIAEKREPKNKNQQQTLAKEVIQARILANRGSVVYLLPECAIQDHEKHPDAVVDGYVMEFKTVTGSIRQIEVRFKESRLQADRVFFKIDAVLTRQEVSRKLSGIIKDKGYRGGHIMAYFTETGELCHWNVEDLR